MSDASDIVARAIERRRADPTQLLQILREIQEELRLDFSRDSAFGRRRSRRFRRPRWRVSFSFTRSSMTSRAAGTGSCFPTTSPTACSAA